jgi:hypothetical protein
MIRSNRIKAVMIVQRVVIYVTCMKFSELYVKFYRMKYDVLLIKPLSIVDISIFFHRYLARKLWNSGIYLEEKLLKPYSSIKIFLINKGVFYFKGFFIVIIITKNYS